MVETTDDPELVGGEATFEKNVSDVWEHLGRAGWSLGRGDNDTTKTISISFGLPERLRRQNEAVFLEVPMWNDEGDPLPGFKLLDEDAGVAVVGYEGPIDNVFMEVVEAMVLLAQAPEVRDGVEEKLARWAEIRRAQAGAAGGPH